MPHFTYPNSMHQVPAGELGVTVAIIMRTRDRPVLLARALASVLAQTHQDWRLLLVNDGGDAAVLDALVARHETGFAGRMRVRHEPVGLGMEAASNTALAMAGEGTPFQFVAVHDDDDSWDPDFLARTTAWLDAPDHAGFAAVMTHWVVVRERLDGEGVIEDGRDRAFFDMPAAHYMSFLARNRMPPICLLVRAAVTLASGPFNHRMRALGDWDYALRVLALGDIGVIEAPLARYHHRDVAGLPEYRNSFNLDRRHEVQHALYRNAWLRTLAGRDPALLAIAGELGAQAETYHEQSELQHNKILANLDRNGLWGHARHEDLQARLIRVEQLLEQIQASLARTWSRRFIDRLRRLFP